MELLIDTHRRNLIEELIWLVFLLFDILSTRVFRVNKRWDLLERWVGWFRVFPYCISIDYVWIIKESRFNRWRFFRLNQFRESHNMARTSRSIYQLWLLVKRIVPAWAYILSTLISSMLDLWGTVFRNIKLNYLYWCSTPLWRRCEFILSFLSQLKETGKLA